MVRRRLVIVAVAAIALVIGVLVVRTFVYLPIGDAGADSIHQARSLPATIHVCGRDWHKSALDHGFSNAEIVGTYGGPPTLVDTRLFAPCPAGACNVAGSAPCETVVFVRVGADEYVDYALSGGP